MAFNNPKDFFCDEILQVCNNSGIGTAFEEDVTPPELDKSVFASTTEQEIQSLLEKNKNRNTTKSTATWVRRFEK